MFYTSQHITSLMNLGSKYQYNSAISNKTLAGYCQLEERDQHNILLQDPSLMSYTGLITLHWSDASSMFMIFCNRKRSDV